MFLKSALTAVMSKKCRKYNESKCNVSGIQQECNIKSVETEASKIKY